jgi:D-lactate dehydrogenase (cytochrome)
MTASIPLPAAVLDGLRQLLGERLSTSPAVCEHHGRDESIFAPMPPAAVAYARHTDEVLAIVRLCREHRVPLMPLRRGLLARRPHCWPCRAASAST